MGTIRLGGGVVREAARSSLRLFVGLSLTTALFSSAALNAQVVERFDMGPSGSEVATNFTSVEPTTTYDALSGYGWESPPPSTLQRLGVSNQFVFEEENFPSKLIEDSANSAGAGDFTFRVDVPAGSYWCFVYLGDLGDPGSGILTPMDSMKVIVNGTTVTDDAYARLVTDKASYHEAWGGYKRLAFEVDTGVEEFLFFRFKGSSPISVMGLEVYSYQAPPIAFDRANQQLVVEPSSSSPELDAGVAAMNAHDYATARTHFDAVPSVLEKAWAHSWWMGWLTAEQEPVDTTLLEDTRLALDAYVTANPGDPRGVSLLYELRDFQWGELFNRNRGYTSYPNPKSLGELLLNLCAAVQFFEQMDGDMLSDAPSSTQTASPFFAKAQYLIARNMYSRNTHLSKGYTDGGVFISLQDYAEDNLAIFDALWPRLNPDSSGVDRIFPQGFEALMLTYRIQQGYPPAGQWYPLAPWDGTLPNLAPNELDDAWWHRDGWVDVPIEPGHNPPPWAEYQRGWAERLRAAGRFWAEEREIDGELGGGAGDDVEAAALVLPRMAVVEGPDDIVESAFKRVLDQEFADAEFDVDQGYKSIIIDSAHGGESASFPLIYFLDLRYGDARYLNQAIHNIRNLDENSEVIPSDLAWTGYPSWSLDPKARQFKAFWFSATQLAGAPKRQADIPLNYRAILGGFPLMDYNGCPRAVELFEELAWGWRQVAMDPSLASPVPKPLGVFPISVDYANGHFGRTTPAGPEWWANNVANSGSFGDYHGVVYTALYDAYLRSTLPTSERVKLLEPIHLAIRLVATHPPDNAVGSPGWVARRIGAAVANIAFRAEEVLAATWGTSAADIDSVIAQYGSSYVKYLDEAPGPSGKDKTLIEDTFESAVTWLDFFFPLPTTTVSYCDRIFVGGPDKLHALFSMRNGAPAFNYVPTNPIQWSNLDPTQGVADVALLVNDYKASGESGGGTMKVLAFNFDPTPKTMRLKFWRTLSPGNYRISVGPDADWNDLVDHSVPTTDVSIDYKGDFVDLVIPPGVLQVVDIIQLSAFGASLPLSDLGLSEDLFSADAGPCEVTVSNLGSASYAGGTATLELRDDQDVLLEFVVIPAILAPGIPGSTNLDAQTWTHTFTYVPFPDETLIARIVNPDTEITSENDEVRKTF